MKLAIPPYQIRFAIQRLGNITLLLFFFLTCVQLQLSAQYNIAQNKVWAFTKYRGVNFLPGPTPVGMTTSINTEEGSASVSDNFGNLLFYTGGVNFASGAEVYDRTRTVMPNGSAIVPFGIYSCTQAAAIIPVIGNPNHYYVFSLEHGAGASGWGVSTISCRLYYCIVDMTLNGGFGDVIPSTIATPLDSGLSEKMTVTAGNNCDIWLVTHEKDAPHFKAYNISSSGISAPVVSTSTGEIPTGLNAYKVGTIKVSPNKTMILNCVMNGGYTGGLDRLELLQFNSATGIVTGCQVLNNFTNQYDAEFSPDNSKLYVHVMGSKVYQYDLSLLPNIAAVISSQYLVYTSPDWGGQMKLAPDGKIYLQTSVGFLDCINSPNFPGSLCNYTYHAVPLVGTSPYSHIGMPNIQFIANLTDTITTRKDSAICGLVGSKTLNALSGFAWYVWNNGATTPSITVIDSGTYWVKTASGCNLQIDTFKVSIDTLAVIPAATTSSFCTGSSATLTAPPGYIAHAWNTGATTSSVIVTAAGSYWVADTNLSACMLHTDTFHVTANSLTQILTEATVSFCSGSSATLAAPPGYTAHVWNTGATASSIIVNAAGTYWVTDTNLSTCILHTKTIHVTAIPSPIVMLGNDTTICFEDSIVLSSPLSVGSFLWSTSSTELSVTVKTGGTYYLTVTKQGCSTSDTVEISPLSVPLPIALGPDTILCQKDLFILSSDPYEALWSTGVFAKSIVITDSGTYSATLTNACGSAVSQIKVDFEPCDFEFPSAFTPNGDGRNDIARAIGNFTMFSDYKLSIYNRYGQRVFYTEDIYAGWNGRFNDVPQDLGTYFYSIKYTLRGNLHISSGDITLIR